MSRLGDLYHVNLPGWDGPRDTSDRPEGCGWWYPKSRRYCGNVRLEGVAVDFSGADHLVCGYHFGEAQRLGWELRPGAHMAPGYGDVRSETCEPNRTTAAPGYGEAS